MAEIIKGLFGIDPQGYQQNQLDQTRANAIEFAKLDPFQKASVGMYQGVQQGIGAGLNMMGVQDPDLQAQQIASQLAPNYDMNDTDSLQQFRLALQSEAQRTGNGKLSEFASMVGNKIMQIKATGAEIGLKQAQAVKALREPTAGISTLIGKSTPESVAVYQKTGNIADLVVAEKPEQLGDSTVKEIATSNRMNHVLSSSNTTLDSWLDKIEKKTVVFGLGERANQKIENLQGGDSVSANTLELNSLEKFVERERNNILMAAKGTQTEGDAERALNQILKNTDWNSAASVKKALMDLKAYKEEQIAANNVYIDSLRGTKKIGAASQRPAASTTSSPSAAEVDTNQYPASWKSDYEKWKARHGQDVPFAVYAQTRKAKQQQTQ